MAARVAGQKEKSEKPRWEESENLRKGKAKAMKVRKDYEKTRWYKLLQFLNGEEDLKGDLEAGLVARKNELVESLNADMEEYGKQNEEELRRREEASEARRERENTEIRNALERYRNWPDTRGLKIFNRFYRIVSLTICFMIIFVLLVAVAELPRFGDPNSPANSSEVVERYIEEGQKETGAVNIVTGMILDYRAFDTLGESHVLFIAACTVLILLRIDLGQNRKPNIAGVGLAGPEDEPEPVKDMILQKVAFLVVPITLIFGIYVILNGHISPGGGFSGGAIIGAGLILYSNAYGTKKTQRFFTYKTFSAVSVCALLFYAASKCYSFFCGANHLDSGIPLGTPGELVSSGLILPLNICVGCVVACTMYSFYAIFRKGGL